MAERTGLPGHGALKDRVAVVTGGGRGLGREHALLLAAEGAKVVVNDIGEAGQEVAAEIATTGGQAVAHVGSVADYDSARELVATAVAAFGDLHVVVNNAGIVRDRVFVNMSEKEFDSVVSVHLKGTFAVSRWAAEHWRNQAKAGLDADRSIVNTSSGSGLHGNFGQSNYAAAKAGIVGMTVVAAMELRRYGVRVNAIAPVARTAMTLTTPGLGDAVAPPEDDSFDVFDPANVSPLVACLAAADCPFTGQVFSVVGGSVGLYAGWSIAEEVRSDTRWTVVELAAAMKDLPREIEVRTQASVMARA